MRAAEALDLIQLVTTNDASRLVDGQVQYSALPTEEGGVVDDLLVYRKAADRFMLVVNAANIDKDFNWITSRNRFDARLKNVSDQTTLLSIQGPRAQEILQSLTEDAFRTDSVLPLRSRTACRQRMQLSPARATLVRTVLRSISLPNIPKPSGMPSSKAGQPFGLLPAGLGARNTLRLEAKLLLYGNDMDETKTLLEAGLGWIVKLEKGDFIGRAALERQKQQGIKRSSRRLRNARTRYCPRSLSRSHQRQRGRSRHERLAFHYFEEKYRTHLSAGRTSRRQAQHFKFPYAGDPVMHRLYRRPSIRRR